MCFCNRILKCEHAGCDAHGEKCAQRHRCRSDGFAKVHRHSTVGAVLNAIQTGMKKKTPSPSPLA